MDLSILAQAGAALNGAATIAKGLIALDKVADVQGKAVELQTVILQVQQSLFAAQTQEGALLEEVRALKAKLAEVEAWKATEDQHQLTALEPGKFVYVSKANAPPTPEHWLCANCFNQRKKSILQHSWSSQGVTGYECPACKFGFQIGQMRPVNYPRGPSF